MTKTYFSSEMGPTKTPDDGVIHVRIINVSKEKHYRVTALSFLTTFKCPLLVSAYFNIKLIKCRWNTFRVIYEVPEQFEIYGYIFELLLCHHRDISDQEILSEWFLINVFWNEDKSIYKKLAIKSGIVKAYKDLLTWNWTEKKNHWESFYISVDFGSSNLMNLGVPSFTDDPLICFHIMIFSIHHLNWFNCTRVDVHHINCFVWKHFNWVHENKLCIRSFNYNIDYW